jgi:tetratricopeptide (TPR) repeat protein
MKMKARIPVLTLLCSTSVLIAGLCAVSAQTQAPAQPATRTQTQTPATQPAGAAPKATPTPNAPPVPPDRKAYLEALKPTDPQLKVAALEKYVADFPDSPGVTSANQTILTTMIKNWPDQQDRIFAHARKSIQMAQDFAKGNAYTSIINALIDANILLDRAEELAREGLAWTDEDLAKRARQTRAPHLANLGRLYVRRGKPREAEKALKEALAANPLLTDAALGLAELSEKRKDDKMAVEYYATAVLTGRAKPEVREKLRAAYKRTHNDSLDGLDALLDTKYKKDFPLPVTVEHYTPGPSRTSRTVLAEVFTGSGCPPCVAADLAFDAYLERYPRKDVAVLMYHQHIPLPDPMTNPATQARAKFYGVTGVPSYAIDGDRTTGGGSREMTKGFYDRVRPTIEKRLNTAADADVKLDATLSAGAVKVSAKVDGVKSEAKKLRLQIALAEETLRYSGENGIRFHPMVVRAMAGEMAGGFAVEAGKGTSAEWSFDLAAITKELKAHLDEFEEKRKEDKFAFSEKKHEIAANNLVVVAFVQDEDSKQILQSTVIRLKPEIAAK